MSLILIERCMHSNTDRFTCAHKISHHAPGAGLRADQRRAGPEARALHVVRQAEGGHRRGHAAAPESGPRWGRGPATAGVGRQAYMACGGPEGKYSEHRRLFCESRTRKAKRKLERGKEWLSLVFFLCFWFVVVLRFDDAIKSLSVRYGRSDSLLLLLAAVLLLGPEALMDRPDPGWMHGL